MPDRFDVTVVGAGMAGIVAARDLSKQGYSVVLLEARHRIGGRTYTEKAFGREVELGGAYVHWTLPNVWHEMQRHGISVKPPINAEKVYWLADGAMHCGTESDHSMAVEPAITRLVADAGSRFPKPFEPGAVDNTDIEKETLEERINSLNLSTYDRDVLDGILSGMVHSYSQHGVDQLLLWVATNFGEYKAFFETGSYWAIDGGTKRLIDAIMVESSAELRVSTPVSSIIDDGSQVTVTTRTGQKIHSLAVVVAVPLNTINDITITPDVAPRVRTMIDQKNPVMGGKIWARVKGEIEPFTAFAPISKNHINVARTESRYKGDTLVLCMCSDATKIRGHDREAVQAALRKFVPDIQVIDTASHDWVTDEFSKGAWMMHRPGNLTDAALQMRKPHGRVHFAGGDISLPLVTSIDGAMGTGAAAARDIAAQLASDKGNRPLVSL